MTTWHFEVTEKTKNILVITLSTLGLLISAFISLFIENGGSPPGCTIYGTPFDCDRVINSAYGNIFGIPVSDIGAFYFLVLLGLYIVGLQDDLTDAIMSVVGLGSIIYFIFIELIVLDAFCLYCTSVHIIVILIFVLIGPDSIRRTIKKYKSKN